LNDEHARLSYGKSAHGESASGESTMANRHMAKRHMAKRRIPVFLYLAFHNVLTIMLYFYHSRWTHFKIGWHPIFYSYTFLIQRKHHRASYCVNTLITLIDHYSDPSLFYIKGCSSINKRLCFGTFIDWEDHHLFFLLLAHIALLSNTCYFMDFVVTHMVRGY